MTNQLQILDNQEFGRIRMILIEGEPWFITKDISDILGYAKAGNMLKLLDEDEYRMISPQTLDTTGYPIKWGDLDQSNFNNKLTIINESGFYSACLHSKKPS